MRILVTGGGTGGHIYPALAFIREMKKSHPTTSFCYVGTTRGLESKLVPSENIPFEAIDISGLKRKLSFENVKVFIKLIRSYQRSKQILKRFQPDVVVGTGGYVTAPVLLAAARLGIPTLIHEQNSIPGITNRILSKIVSKVAISFQHAEKYFPTKKTYVTGNPRATEVVNVEGDTLLSELGISEGKKIVLLVGGSQGARPINELTLQMIPSILNKPYHFVYITGDRHFETIQHQIQQFGQMRNITILPFLHRMPEMLANTSLIICRSGATTLAEIAAVGIPSILIPSPYVTENHQEINAQSFVSVGAAKMVRESELSSEQMIQMIDLILEKTDIYESMKLASKQVGIPTAAQNVVQLVVELSSTKRGLSNGTIHRGN